MRDFIKTIRFKIIVAILTVMAGFMVMAVYSGGSAPLFSQLTSFITTPIQKISSAISGTVGDFLGKVTNVNAIYDDNERLREEVNDLRRQLVDYDKAKHENEQFREILGVMEDRRDFTFETASVIARDPLDRFHSFTIDKGSLDNIKVMDPVMTADGLVGYVVEVGSTYAKVQTILDITASIGAYDSACREVGIVSGTIDLAAEGKCQLEYLARDTDVAAGDLVLTSGGSMFPRDLVIGTVTELTPSYYGTGMAAVIEPAAQVQSVKDVYVITHFEGQGEE